MDKPFTLTVFDKNLNRAGFIAQPISVSVTPRHNAIGSLTLTLPLIERLLPAVTAPGARITCDYLGEPIFSGPRRALTGVGPLSSGSVTISFEDDKRLMWRLVGYPSPGSPIDTQPYKEDRRVGPAETVFKEYISANKGRDPRPITVVPTHGWGSTIDITGMRMVPLADKLIEPFDQSGLGFTVKQNATGLIVDCYQPRTFNRALTVGGGALLGWTWSEQPPSATATIIGGPNVGTSREFTRLSNAPRQAEWGDVIEVLTDAGSEVLTADRAAAGQKTLDAAGPKAGFGITLQETKAFHYGGPGGLRVGDMVTANVAGQDRTDVLREATLSWDRENGFRVAPVMGDHTDDPDKFLLSLVATLRRGVRNLTNR